MSKTNKQIEKLLKKYAENVVKKAEEDYKDVIYEVNEIISDEVTNMYNSYIDKFYSYKTTSYIRHGTSKPGAGYGRNLYKGLNVNIDKNKSTITIEYNGNGNWIQSMSDYEYQYDDPDTVLNYVMHGIRFPHYLVHNSNNEYIDMSWSHKYVGKHFSCDGTLQDAVNMFDYKFNNIAESIFLPLWNKKGWN